MDAACAAFSVCSFMMRSSSACKNNPLLRCLQSQVQHSLARAYALSNLLSLNQSTVKSNRVRVCARVCVLSSPAHQQVHALRCGLLQESKRSTGADHSGVLLLHILVLSLQVLLRLLQALAFLAGVFELLLQRVDLTLVRRLSRLQRACPSTGENAVAMTRLNRPVINGGTCWALARSIATFCMCALFC